MKAVFLDRDGVINQDLGYVTSRERVKVYDQVPEALKILKSQGYKILVISNQSAVARGMASLAEVEQTNQWIDEKTGRLIDQFYVCPFLRSGKTHEFARDSFHRKPNPGMLIKAKMDWQLNFNDCWMVGDKFSDIEAASRVQVRGIQIIHPKSVMHPKAFSVLASLIEAVETITRKTR